MTGPNPVDRGKPGSMIHVLSDVAGVPMVVAVSAANTHDCQALKPLVIAIPAVRSRRGPRRRRPAKRRADKGYDYEDVCTWLRRRGTTPRIARRGIESSERLGRHRWKSWSGLVVDATTRTHPGRARDGGGGPMALRFYTGTHQPHWLHRVDFPLLVSHRQLGGGARRRPYRRAACQWALDSGGFSELTRHGAWTVTPAAYVAAVRRYGDEIGGLDWAAIQDWMCEPFMVARTGLTVREYQPRTVGSYLDLRALAPDLPLLPVLQGFTRAEYLECLARNERAGIDLAAEPLVGLGSVCRRQSDRDIQALVAELSAAGLHLHGFGIKVRGLRRFGHLLAAADSMAWSYAARRGPATGMCGATTVWSTPPPGVPASCARRFTSSSP